MRLCLFIGHMLRGKRKNTTTFELFVKMFSGWHRNVNEEYLIVNLIYKTQEYNTSMKMKWKVEIH